MRCGFILEKEDNIPLLLRPLQIMKAQEFFNIVVEYMAKLDWEDCGIWTDKPKEGTVESEQTSSTSF
jgi:hypothetical protein